MVLRFIYDYLVGRQSYLIYINDDVYVVFEFLGDISDQNVLMQYQS